ncbi:MAG TPA: hypothetical protein VEM13_00955 [Gemmatimonadales bacterium]|nr:hypothetical protein [Gemmatimonadales bacterium]
MKDSLPFDHRPDPVLGSALRQALDPGDSAEFVARVLARAQRLRTGSWDAVLARWARVGVAAAVVIALSAAYLLGHGVANAAPGRTSVPDALLAPSTQAPEAEAILASVIDN